MWWNKHPSVVAGSGGGVAAGSPGRWRWRAGLRGNAPGAQRSVLGTAGEAVPCAHPSCGWPWPGDGISALWIGSGGVSPVFGRPVLTLWVFSGPGNVLTWATRGRILWLFTCSCELEGRRPGPRRGCSWWKSRIPRHTPLGITGYSNCGLVVRTLPDAVSSLLRALLLRRGVTYIWLLRLKEGLGDREGSQKPCQTSWLQAQESAGRSLGCSELKTGGFGLNTNFNAITPFVCVRETEIWSRIFHCSLTQNMDHKRDYRYLLPSSIPETTSSPWIPPVTGHFPPLLASCIFFGTALKLAYGVKFASL